MCSYINYISNKEITLKDILGPISPVTGSLLDRWFDVIFIESSLIYWSEKLSETNL